MSKAVVVNEVHGMIQTKQTRLNGFAIERGNHWESLRTGALHSLRKPRFANLHSFPGMQQMLCLENAAKFKPF